MLLVGQSFITQMESVSINILSLSGCMFVVLALLYHWTTVKEFLILNGQDVGGRKWSDDDERQRRRKERRWTNHSAGDRWDCTPYHPYHAFLSSRRKNESQPPPPPHSKNLGWNGGAIRMDTGHPPSTKILAVEHVFITATISGSARSEKVRLFGWCGRGRGRPGKKNSRCQKSTPRSSSSVGK